MKNALLSDKPGVRSTPNDKSRSRPGLRSKLPADEKLTPSDESAALKFSGRDPAKPSRWMDRSNRRSWLPLLLVYKPPPTEDGSIEKKSLPTWELSVLMKSTSPWTVGLTLFVK